MPQIQLPIFPASSTAITAELAFEQRDGQVCDFGRTGGAYKERPFGENAQVFFNSPGNLYSASWGIMVKHECLRRAAAFPSDRWCFQGWEMIFVTIAGQADDTRRAHGN